MRARILPALGLLSGALALRAGPSQVSLLGLRASPLSRSRLAGPLRMCAAEAAAEGPVRFSMLDVRVGKIVEVWNHPDSEKLFCEKIDVGEAEPREIASGLRAHYTLEQLKDRSVLVVCNLKAAKLAGFESSGMVFCASSSDKGVVEFVDPPVGAAPGDRMLTQSEFAAVAAAAAGEGAPAADVEPATSNQMKKKKFMEKIGAELKTDGEKLATYMGEPLVVGGERCTAPTVAGGSIS